MTKGRRPPISAAELAQRVAILRTPTIPKVSEPGRPRRILHLLATDEHAAIIAFRAYMRQRQPDNTALQTHFQDERMVLCALHKARCAAEDFPLEERSTSKRWLLANGFHPTDGGRVPDDR